MLGFDSIHFKPRFRAMKTVRNPYRGNLPKIHILSSDALRGPGSTSWEQISNTTSEARFGDHDSEQWADTVSGLHIKIQGNLITGVQANMSRLLTDNDHNGVIVRDQSQVDKALSRMWDILDSISEGERSGEFTSVEFGGVIEAPYSRFELILKHRNLPGLRKPPHLRASESLKFGGGRKPPISLQFYDKGLEMGARKLDIKPKDVRDKWTRIELKLMGKKLREHMGDWIEDKDERQKRGGEPVTELNHSKWVEKFFEILYSLDPDDQSELPIIGTKIPTFLAMMSEHDHLRIDGNHVVDIYLNTGSRDRKKKLRKAITSITSRKVSLRELIPDDPMPQFIDLVPFASTIEKKEN